MSYCVNCGVELDASLSRCPLCGVEVINPAVRFDPEAASPYPRDVERVRHRVVRVTTARVLSLLMAIPLISILLVDLIQDGRMSWSLIPAAVIVYAFMAFVFPCLFNRPRVWLFMLFGVIETALLLFVIYMILGGGGWLWLFALPITLLTGAAVIGAYLMISSKRASMTLKTVIVLLIIMVFVLVLQMLIEIHLHKCIRFDWSLYAAIPCGMLSIVALIIGRLIRKNAAFRKKMFF